MRGDHAVASDAERTWLIVSAALLAVPTGVSAVYQPMILTIVLANATYASVGYHWTSEDQYEWGFQDMFWANLLVLVLSTQVSLVWASAARKNAWVLFRGPDNAHKWYTIRIPKRWELWAALATGGVALFTYLYRGRLVCNPEMEHETGCRPGQYNSYHIAWHVLSATATTFLMLVPGAEYILVFLYSWRDFQLDKHTTDRQTRHEVDTRGTAYMNEPSLSDVDELDQLVPHLRGR